MMNKLLSILCLLFLCVSCTSVEIAANLGKKILPEDFKNKGFQKPVYKIGDRYEVGGVSYLPKKNLNYNETGIASWYGPNFHGKLTANGEIFNQYEMTAAHKTLPMPSVVKVINLDNGLSTVVRINDRGPFVNNRIIDLSYAAAKKLKLDQKGTVEVRVVLLKSESIYLEKLAKKGEFPEIKDLKNFSTPPIIKPNLSDVNIQSIGNKKKEENDPFLEITNKTRILRMNNISYNLFIQIASFSNKKSALLLKEKFKGIKNIFIEKTLINKQDFYRVKVGPFKNLSNTIIVHKYLKEKGMEGPKIQIKKDKL